MIEISYGFNIEVFLVIIDTENAFYHMNRNFIERSTLTCYK